MSGALATSTRNQAVHIITELMSRSLKVNCLSMYEPDGINRCIFRINIAWERRMRIAQQPPAS